MSSKTLLRRNGRRGSRVRTGLFLSAALAASVAINGPSHAGPNTCAPGTCTTETNDLSTIRAEDLVRSFVGPGVTYSNVAFHGVREGAGLVTQVDPAVYGFSGGIALSTGCVFNLPGPNSSPGITCSNGGPGDQDLEAITGIPSFDAAVLEFDFVPDSDTINFRYVFSSDEYNEWVGAAYNDTFAFFVNGDNITWIPGTKNEPVQIASVNNGNPRGLNNPKHPNLYRDNDVWDPALPVPTGWDTEMDGLTRVFAAQATVRPNALNHIKIVVADLGDDLLDSNVILQQGSFTTGCADTDVDGVCDGPDNCVFDVNGNQADADHDGIGDACDVCPNDPDPAHQDPHSCGNNGGGGPGPMNRPPIAVCANQTIFADGMCTGCATVNGGSYDPDGDPITCTTNVGCPYRPGANDIVLTCVDSKGASASCQGTITVVDATPPTVTCPSDVVLACVYGGGLLNYGAPSATDNCGIGVPASCGPGPGATLADNTVTPILCAATDTSNNRGQCVFRATVVNRAPVARCAPQVVNADGACTGWADVNAGSYDPDGGPVSCTQTSGPYGLGVNNIVLNCTDSCGGTSSCTTTVTVVDQTPPTIICPPDQFLQCATQATFSTSSGDNCGAPTVTCTPGSGSQFPLGFTADRCVAVDSSGNAASCDFQVDVMNGNPPVVREVNHSMDIYEDDSWWQQVHEPPQKACSGDWNIFPFQFTPCELEAFDGCTGQPLDITQAVTFTRVEWYGYMMAREAADPAQVAAVIQGMQAQMDIHSCEKLSFDKGFVNLPIEWLEETPHDYGTFYKVYYEVKDLSGNVTSGVYRVNLFETYTGELQYRVDSQNDPGVARVEVGPALCYGQGCPQGAPTRAQVCATSLALCEQYLDTCQQKGDCADYNARCVTTCKPLGRLDCEYGINWHP